MIDLLSQIFVYDPGKRPTALEAMNNPAFSELFSSELSMLDGRPLPV